jgi:hypothetical protein
VPPNSCSSKRTLVWCCFLIGTAKSASIVPAALRSAGALSFSFGGGLSISLRCLGAAADPATGSQAWSGVTVTFCACDRGRAATLLLLRPHPARTSRAASSSAHSHLSLERQVREGAGEPQ